MRTIWQYQAYYLGFYHKLHAQTVAYLQDGDLVTLNKQVPITGSANEIGGNAKPYYSSLVTAQAKYGRRDIHAS